MASTAENDGVEPESQETVTDVKEENIVEDDAVDEADQGDEPDATAVEEEKGLMQAQGDSTHRV